MSKPVGDLGRKSARWMTANAHELKDVIPFPDHTWKWSNTDLTRSQFSYLRRQNLIEQVGEQEWRTTEKCIQAIADYGRIPRDEIGTYVDYDRSWFETPAEGCPRFDGNRGEETFDHEQTSLDA
ncbi:hypothetical protein [Halopenitus persicus]|nr:hypothetical protein [Halopenitus persicus]